nr:N-alpha-acetyltransferase 30-like isoform X2 [Cherax quadricarinatus]
MSEAHLRRVLVEDIPSLVGHTADLAPVHTARSRTTHAHAMDPLHTARARSSHAHGVEQRPGAEGAHGSDKRGEVGGHGSSLASELRDKLTFKMGVINGMKIGTTDAEVHVPALARAHDPALARAHDPAMARSHDPALARSHDPAVARSHDPAVARSHDPAVARSHDPAVAWSHDPAVARSHDPALARAHEPILARAHEPALARAYEPALARAHEPALARAHEPALAQSHEQCSQSSQESVAKADFNGAVCNGHSVSEATSSNSISISDTFSINSEKSSDSSHSFSGARPRTRNASNSSQGTQPKSDNDLSSTSESLITPEICISPVLSTVDNDLKVDYVNYENELQMSAIMRLIQKDLSEPYSIYTYRYFIHNWPKLCFLAMSSGEVVGAIVCKLDVHKKVTVRGYIAMLAVDHRFRKRKIGSNLVQRAIRAMASDDADEVVLETEITNKPALRLYENLGFVRDKRLFRYYLNGVDALRLKLWLR